MVSPPASAAGSHQALVRWLAFGQWLAVGLILINHLPITLLKALAGQIPPALSKEPALMAVTYLFFSSGMLMHLTQNPGRGWDRLAFLVRRFWRLAVPVYAVVLFDVFVASFPDLWQAVEPAQAWPMVASLTHTWVYKMLGQGSLTFPFGGSNLAWIAADLFFLSMVYALLHLPVRRLRSGLSAWGVGLAVLLQWLWFDQVVPSASLTQWAAERFGTDMVPTLSLGYWLAEYCPLTQLAPFMAGVLCAQWHAATTKASRSDPAGRAAQAADASTRWGPLAGLLVAALLSLWFGASSFEKGLGLSLLLALLLRTLGDVAPAPAPGPAWGTWRERLGASSLELFIVHQIVFIPFTVQALTRTDTVQMLVLGLRTGVLVLCAMALSLWLAEKLFAPLTLRLNRFFGLTTPAADRWL